MTAMNVPAVLLLAVDVVILAVVILNPLRRRFDDSDKGEGNVVILPDPRRSTLWRIAAYVGAAIVCSVGLIGLRNPDLTASYRDLVRTMVEWVVRDPSLVQRYTETLRPIIPMGIVAFVIAEALALPATVGRRVVVLCHAPLALAAAAVADTCLCTFGVETHLPLGPVPIVSILLHYTVAYSLGMRLAMTNYQLPRATQIPRFRGSNMADNVLVCLALCITLLSVASAAVYVLSLSGTNPVLYVFVLIALPAYLKFGLFSVLSVLHLFGRRPPRPSGHRPLVNVIAPAFNESDNIIAWVQSIDQAARVYGGPVHVLLCDDGSTDDTVVLATQAMAECEYATGEVLAPGHRGKATALNEALSQCTADYVVRHDADCLLHREALLYTVPWFEQDPSVGLVGAFMVPKMPFSTWVDRMRAIELMTGFGLPRLGFSVVDSQPCVPGNFTAFRRLPALAIGGFTEGMTGEDIDFTCNIARIGYRAVYDRRIWAYEDVPDSFEQLRLQRRRWNRGSVHNFARFDPFAAGSTGPRFWFAEFLRAARRLVMPIQLTAFIYGVQLALFNPSARTNLAHLLFFYIVAKSPMVVLAGLSLCYRRMPRVILWWPMYYVFALVKRMANLEAMLTLPTRSVESQWQRARREAAQRDSRATEGVEWPVLRPTILYPS